MEKLLELREVHFQEVEHVKLLVAFFKKLIAYVPTTYFCRVSPLSFFLLCYNTSPGRHTLSSSSCTKGAYVSKGASALTHLELCPNTWHRNHGFASILYSLMWWCAWWHNGRTDLLRSQKRSVLGSVHNALTSTRWFLACTYCVP